MSSFRAFQSVLLSRWALLVLLNHYSFLNELFLRFSINTPFSMSSFRAFQSELLSQWPLFMSFSISCSISNSDTFFHSCHYCKCEHGNIHCHAGWRRPMWKKNTKNTSLSGKGFKGVGKHYCYGRWVELIIKWKPNISNMHSISRLYKCTTVQCAKQDSPEEQCLKSFILSRSKWVLCLSFCNWICKIVNNEFLLSI